MIFAASIVVFGEYSFFLGPVLVGMLVWALDVAHLRKREWDKIAFNCASDALSLLRRTAVFLVGHRTNPIANSLILRVAVVGSRVYVPARQRRRS